MDPIQEINEVSIQQVRSWMYTPPAVPNTYVPVTIQLGLSLIHI